VLSITFRVPRFVLKEALSGSLPQRKF